MNDIDDETPTASDNDDDDVIWSRCGLRSIQNIGVHGSRERGVCFCANSANQKSFLGTYVFDSSQWQTAVYPITPRLSGVITDIGSSLPLPTTKNSGDWRMRRCVHVIGTQDDAKHGTHNVACPSAKSTVVC